MAPLTMWPGRFHARAGPAGMPTASAMTASCQDICHSLGDGWLPKASEPMRKQDRRTAPSQQRGLSLSNVRMIDGLPGRHPETGLSSAIHEPDPTELAPTAATSKPTHRQHGTDTGQTPRAND